MLSKEESYLLKRKLEILFCTAAAEGYVLLNNFFEKIRKMLTPQNSLQELCPLVTPPPLNYFN